MLLSNVSLDWFNNTLLKQFAILVRVVRARAYMPYRPSECVGGGRLQVEAAEYAVSGWTGKTLPTLWT